MWFFLQTLIFFGVMFHSIYYGWNENPMAVGLVAMGTAWLVTAILSSLIERGRQRRLRRAAERLEQASKQVALGLTDPAPRISDSRNRPLPGG